MKTFTNLIYQNLFHQSMNPADYQTTTQPYYKMKWDNLTWKMNKLQTYVQFTIHSPDIMTVNARNNYAGPQPITFGKQAIRIY